ncbi:MAG: metallophosphoesterase [Phycisphaeraceae bacterium]
MPLTLSPLSRRRVLATSLAADTAMMVDPQDLMGPRPRRDPNRVVLISDTHIATDPATVERGVNMVEHMKAMVAQVLALDGGDGPPARVLHCGDCAHHTGETSDYEHFVALLQPWRLAGLPIHLAMGNHDQRERFGKVVPYQALGDGAVFGDLAQRYVMVAPTPRADWVMLDSLDQTNEVPGTVGQAQLDWLAEVLDDPSRGGKPVLVMVHHQMDEPPAVSAPDAPPHKLTGLVDTRALLDVLLPRRQVKALFVGHTHRWSITQVEGLHLVNLPAVAYVFREGQPSGWVDAHLMEKGLRMRLQCLDERHAKHGEVVELTWRE